MSEHARKQYYVNTMLSDQYEIYHVKDNVNNEKAVYHYHDFYEVHATLEGVATFYLDNRQFDITPGTVLLIHYNDLHRIIKQSTDYFERVYIFLTEKFLQDRSTEWTNLETCFHPIGEQRSKVLQLKPEKLHELLQFVDQKPSPEAYGSDILYEQQLVNYMMYLNQLIEEDTQENHALPNIQNERIVEMIHFITQNLSNALTLDEMEQTFYVSKYYITREFKKYTGFTFHQFVLKKKLLYAKQLLKQYKSSSDVYSKCGFNSYPHFLKAFKKEFGITPKEFLKHANENPPIKFTEPH